VEARVDDEAFEVSYNEEFSGTNVTTVRIMSSSNTLSYTLAAWALAALGWLGLVGLFIYINPNVGPLPWWSFYVLALMAITGTAVPFVHLLNRRFMREAVAAGVILRQAMWVGVFVTTTAWMLRSGLLNPATAVLLLVALVGVEWFLRLREGARWAPTDYDD